MSDLAEFLAARIREDEDAARFNASVDDASLSPCPFSVVGGDCWTPARVLAECEAKRRIIRDLYAGAGLDNEWDAGYTNAIAEVLRRLALPYADHPDFREEWRR